MTDFDSVDSLLAHARRDLVRLTPLQAAVAVESGALIIDIRPTWQRRNDGEIPGSIVIERNHLEWRLHPGSGASIEQARPDHRWIVVCAEVTRRPSRRLRSCRWA